MTTTKTDKTAAIAGHLYCYTNSIIANNNLKCRGMVDANKLTFWAEHYITDSDASNKKATLVAFSTHYEGDQLTEDSARELAHIVLEKDGEITKRIV